MAVEELYCSLNKLLDDICKFLADESNYKNLSPGARKHADELINRSKHQLQEIAKVTECDGAYVDMEKEKKSAGSNEDDKENIYSSVEELNLSNSTATKPPQNPYANLAAKDLSKQLKHGSLLWRCRIILKIEKMRKIYAGVHNNWLLLYSNEKDSKPQQTFDLRYYKAQNVPCKQGKNLQDFEIFSTIIEKKSYFFSALTHKDMLQWVSQINKCHDSFDFEKNEKSPIIEEDEQSETYDQVINPSQNHNESDDEDGEVIYTTLETVSSLPSPENVNIPPELPLRRPLKSPLPIPPPVVKDKEKSTESLSSTSDSNKSKESQESNSFSEEEEEEEVYEVFVKLPEKKDNLLQNKKQSLTNSIQLRPKPDTPIKPKFLGPKPWKNNPKKF